MFYHTLWHGHAWLPIGQAHWCSLIMGLLTKALKWILRWIVQLSAHQMQQNCKDGASHYQWCSTCCESSSRLLERKEIKQPSMAKSVTWFQSNRSWIRLANIKYCLLQLLCYTDIYRRSPGHSFEHLHLNNKSYCNKIRQNIIWEKIQDPSNTSAPNWLEGLNVMQKNNQISHISHTSAAWSWVCVYIL